MNNWTTDLLRGFGDQLVFAGGDTARPAPQPGGRVCLRRASASASYLALQPQHLRPVPALAFLVLCTGQVSAEPGIPPPETQAGAEAPQAREEGWAAEGGRLTSVWEGDLEGGGVQGRSSPAPSPPLQNPRSREHGPNPSGGTMTPERFVLALILGALPEVVSVDPVLTYPPHQRHRHLHSSPSSAQYLYSLPTRQRPQRTPPPPPLPRPPRAIPALQAGHTPRPHPGGCPTGGLFVNVTDFGAPCLRWAEVPPFLQRSPPASWAQLRGQRHNFCRSPDGAGRPWCFYVNAHGKVDWGYCDCTHDEWHRGSGGNLGLARGQPGLGRAEMFLGDRGMVWSLWDCISGHGVMVGCR
jgi:hypothetical protein